MTRKYGRKQRDDVLHDLPVFAGCSGKTMKRVANLGTRLRIPEGRSLVTTGNRGSEVLIVLSGTATCLVGGVERARFGPGEFFGEVATLDGGPRTATVVAGSGMEVLVLNGFEFETLFKSSPEVAHRMLKAMAHRLRQADAQVA